MTARQIAKEIMKTLENDGIVFTCGNGGSDAMAKHMAEEFLCKFVTPRKPLPCYYCWAPTSVANDYGYKYVFSRHIEAFGKFGDVLVTFSTSGTSKNVWEAEKTAFMKGMKVLRMPIKGHSVASIQEYQLKVMHEICRLVDLEYTTAG